MKPASTNTPPATGNCTSGWTYNPSTGFCYGAFYPDQMDWNTSEARCQGFGAHLVSVHSYNETQFVNSKFLEASGIAPSSRSFHEDGAGFHKWQVYTIKITYISANYILGQMWALWIGLYTNDGVTFQWSDNSPVDYLDWDTSYPTPGQTCGIMDEPEGDNLGYFQNEICYAGQSSVCKKLPN